MAVSLLLLVGAALFLRSFRARLDIDPGFGARPAAIVTLQELPSRRTPDEIRNFFVALGEQANALPGVVGAGFTADLHLSPLNSSRAGVTVPGVDPPPDRDDHSILRTTVDARFFDAAGIPIVAGRGFVAADGPDGAPAVVVSEAFANRFWPGRAAVGRTIRADGTDYTVVGVARDTKVDNLGEDPTPFVYFAYAQNPTTGLTLVATTRIGDEATLLDVIALARRLDPEVVIVEAKTMSRHLGAMLLPHRLAAWVVSAFGILALLLASIGLFGVVSYAVSARSREVGIRMALGAAPTGVVRLLMGTGMRLVGLGTAVGLVLALLAGRVMSGLLYGVESMDPVAFLAAPLVLVAVAVLAAWLPARRASRVSPVRSLKAD
jgi:predicted permease